MPDIKRKGPYPMVKRWSAAALALLLLGSVAACGEEEENAAEEASESVEESAEEAAEEAGDAVEEAGDEIEEATD